MLVGALTAAPAKADPPSPRAAEEAQALFDRAVRAMEAGSVVEACPLPAARQRLHPARGAPKGPPPGPVADPAGLSKKRAAAVFALVGVALIAAGGACGLAGSNDQRDGGRLCPTGSCATEGYAAQKRADIWGWGSNFGI